MPQSHFPDDVRGVYHLNRERLQHPVGTGEFTAADVELRQRLRNTNQCRIGSRRCANPTTPSANIYAASTAIAFGLSRRAFFRTKGFAFALDGSGAAAVFCPVGAANLDIQGDNDIIFGQSGSAGEQPDRTKRRVVISLGSHGPFVFSNPFVLKTHDTLAIPWASYAKSG